MAENYIAGRWVGAEAGGRREIRCPADGTLVAEIDESTADDTRAAIAAAHGHPVRPEAMEREFLPFFRTVAPGSAGATASMLRDLEAGRRIEADHILGFLLDAARRAGLPDELHEAVYLHAKAYEARRDAGRLPGS